MRIVHPHLHRRRTGVTRHVESVVAASAEAQVVELGVAGRVVNPALPRTTLGSARGADVWHAHRNGELALGLFLRAFGAKFRIVFTRHSATPPSWITRVLARRADRLIAISDDVAKALPMASSIVGHGVDLERFRPPADRDAAWRALGLIGDFGIGAIGRVRPAKGQGDLVDASDALRKEFMGLRVALVGPVKDREIGFAESLRSRGALVVGEQADIVPWLQGLHVVVQPSHSEGFGLAALEAMACGACVVSTRVGGAEKMIEDGRTGFLYDAGDVSKLAEILGDLVRRPERAREVGAAGAEAARSKFGIADEVRALEAVYREVVER